MGRVVTRLPVQAVPEEAFDPVGQVTWHEQVVGEIIYRELGAHLNKVQYKLLPIQINNKYCYHILIQLALNRSNLILRFLLSFRRLWALRKLEKKAHMNRALTPIVLTLLHFGQLLRTRQFTSNHSFIVDAVIPLTWFYNVGDFKSPITVYTLFLVFYHGKSRSWIVTTITTTIIFSVLFRRDYFYTTLQDYNFKGHSYLKIT